MATFNALIASRSKWFVGSSRMRMFGFCNMSRQKISRAASPPESASVFFNRPRMVLREVADLRFVAPLDRAAVKREVWIGLVHLHQQRLQQRRLAQAVAAHETDLLAAHHRRAEVLDNRLLSV